MGSNIKLYNMALNFIRENEKFYEREYIVRLQKEAKLSYCIGKITLDHS
jgi:hypothetical protein